MTFEGFDAAPLIEGAGFSPLLAGGVAILVAGADGTLEAALQTAGLGPRAAIDPHDLWVGHGAGMFDHGSAPGWRGWLGPGDADHVASGGAKDVLLRAAIFGDDVDGDGEEDAPITVTGRRNVSEDSGGDIGNNYGAGFYPGGTGDTGGGLDQPTQEPNDCRDRNALGAENDISNDSNHNHYEHGSIIYRDASGTVHHAPLIQGSTDHITQAQLLASMTANGISFSQIIGFVHNHPYDTYGAAPYLNGYPSGGAVAGGDWSAAEWMVANGAGGPGGDDFALYVIDPMGRMREFEYSDREMFKNLDQDDREHGRHLPSEVVNDGTSCG